MDQILPTCPVAQALPSACPTRVHVAAVKLDVLSRTEPEPFDTLIRCLDQMVNSTFKYGDTTENKEPLGCIPD